MMTRTVRKFREWSSVMFGSQPKIAFCVVLGLLGFLVWSRLLGLDRSWQIAALYWTLILGPATIAELLLWICTPRLGRSVSRHLFIIAVLAVVLLIIGLGTGWLVLDLTPTFDRAIALSDNAFVFAVAIHGLSALMRRAVQNTVETPVVTDEVHLEIQAIQADDHYVIIHRAEGRHHLRMSLSRAIEVYGVESGMKVHRSWWINSNAIESKVRHGRDVVLKLRCGVRVPVSRRRIDMVPALPEGSGNKPG